VVIHISGTLNGHRFTVEGKGQVDASKGTAHSRLQCVDGELPIAWEALASALNMDMVATKLNGITTFLQGTLPEGFTDQSVTRFPAGNIKSYLEASWKKGVLMLKYTLVADFKADDPVVTKGIKTVKPSEGTVSVYEDDGLETITTFQFPLKTGSGMVTAKQSSVNHKLGGGEMGAEPFVLKRSMTLTKQGSDRSDQIILLTHSEATAQ